MIKPQLLKWLTEEQQRWELLLAAIGENRMDQIGVNRTGNWTMRDMVAHLTDWQRWLVIRLKAAATGQPQPPPPWPAHLTDQNDINAWIYQSNQNRDVREVLGNVRELHEQLVSIIQSLPEDCRIESVESKFHCILIGDQRFPVGEFFHHFYDDHSADVRAWLER